MPTYEYVCEDCKEEFTAIQSISEHAASKPVCPKCKKDEKVKQCISIFTVKTSRKS